MRVAAVVVTVILLLGCSGSGGAGAVGSVVDASGAPVLTLPTETSTAATGASVDISSLSGQIVFSNHDDVWIIDADGTDLRRLTQSPWREFDPSLSPDGRLIAFRSEPNDYPELWLMNADGSRQHRLSEDGGFPAWSLDGSMIAYAPGGGPSGKSSIAIMNPDGSGQRPLPGTDYGEYPSWSPDGTRIAYSSNLSGQALMSIVDVDGSQVVDLSSIGEGGKVAWSPDSRSILFQSHRDHSDNYTDIYVMRPDGTGVERLTRTNGETAAWSPDGRYIVFAAGGLYVMRADGSGIISLPVAEAGEASFPDWR